MMYVNIMKNKTSSRFIKLITEKARSLRGEGNGHVTGTGTRLELRGGQVEVGDDLGARVLDLEARVELEEVELRALGERVRVVQVLDRARALVAHQTHQAHRCLLHLAQLVRVNHACTRAHAIYYTSTFVTYEYV